MSFQVAKDILTNYPSSNGIVAAARLAISFVVMCCYPLQVRSDQIRSDQIRSDGRHVLLPAAGASEADRIASHRIVSYLI